MAETLSEQVAALEMWKESAMQVLAEYDAAWEAAGKPGPLGGSKARALRDYAIAAESREKQAREARAAFVAGALWADREVPADTLNTPMAEAEARRRYPAVPPEREGARTGRKIVGAADDSASATDFVVTTPPQAVPEPPRVREALVEVLAHSVINGDAWVRRLAKRLGVSVEPSLADEKCENAIVDALLALASRPTASGEG